MKASGNLEFYVKMTPAELKLLGTDKLDGLLHFMDDDPPIDRFIPLTLLRIQNQGISVECAPDDKYIGWAEKIIVKINDTHYENLMEKGTTDDRYWSAGRIYIDVK